MGKKVELLLNLLLIAVLMILYGKNLFLEGEKLNFLFLLTNFIIVISSLGMIFFVDKYRYSINKLMHIFIFFVLGLAPLVQFQYRPSFWGGTKLEANNFVIVNVLIIIGIFTYNGCYILAKLLPLSSFEKKNREKLIYNISKKNRHKLTFIIISFIFFMIIYIVRGGFSGLFLRSGSLVDNYKLSTSGRALFNYFLRPVPFIIFYIYYLGKKKKSKVTFILFIIAILSNFPSGLTRNLVAVYYLPMLLYFFKIVRKKNIVFHLITLGLFVIFPILDFFRRFKGDFSFIKEINYFDITLLGRYHFDTYQMFQRVIDLNLLTNGKQLLGTLLFMIPRSLWHGKPVESGVLIARSANLRFEMITLNFFGEGYINFGVIGVLLFSIYKGFFNGRLDKLYWKGLKSSYLRNSVFSIFYMFILGLEFIVHRGSLMSGFSISVGLTFSTFITYKILKNFKCIK